MLDGAIEGTFVVGTMAMAAIGILVGALVGPCPGDVNEESSFEGECEDLNETARTMPDAMTATTTSRQNTLAVFRSGLTGFDDWL